MLSDVLYKKEICHPPDYLGCRANALEGEGESLRGEGQGLSRATMRLPKVVEPATEQGATNGEQMEGPLAAPKHAGKFESLPDDGFAARLHNARTDEITGLAESLVQHPGPVALKVSDLLFGELAWLRPGGQV